MTKTLPSLPTMTPRSYLYVPGDQADVLAKATGRGADALIVDLEDAVRPDRKTFARRTLVTWLHAIQREPPTCEIWIRLNSNPDWRGEDLETLAEAPSPKGLVIAKTENRETLEHITDALPPNVRLQPLVETSRGVLGLDEIALAHGIDRIQLGEADLTADLGMDPEAADDFLSPIRLGIILASSAARIESPVAPVSTNLTDLDRLEASTMRLKKMGFGARAIIHPAQIAVVNRVFTPTPSELDQARRLLDEAAAAAEEGRGVFVDSTGNMVDEAVLKSARRTVARAP